MTIFKDIDFTKQVKETIRNHYKGGIREFANAYRIDYLRFFHAVNGNGHLEPPACAALAKELGLSQAEMASAFKQAFPKYEVKYPRPMKRISKERKAEEERKEEQLKAKAESERKADDAWRSSKANRNDFLIETIKAKEEMDKEKKREESAVFVKLRGTDGSFGIRKTYADHLAFMTTADGRKVVCEMSNGLFKPIDNYVASSKSVFEVIGSDFLIVIEGSKSIYATIEASADSVALDNGTKDGLIVPTDKVAKILNKNFAEVYRR